jgi:hypothetical protein
MKILIILSLYISVSFSQDPGTLIDINITNNGEKIPKKEIENYTVKLIDQSKNAKLHRNKYHISDSVQFSFFKWAPYYGEIFILQISHNEDTMSIAFQMSLDTFTHIDHTRDKRFLWNAAFFLAIPFQPGYFEITDFVRNKSFYYTVGEDYTWVSVPPEKRKLIYNEK